MIASSVPAWVAVVTTVVAGLFGLSGALLVDRRRRQELEQDRLLHGAQARLEVLTDATATALLYRERVAEALRLVAGEPPRSDVEPMWSWDRQNVMHYRRHEAALALLFGPEHAVTMSWGGCFWVIAQAAVFAERQKDLTKRSPSAVTSGARSKANGWRTDTKNSLEGFLATSTRSLEYLQPRESGSKLRRLLRRLGPS